MPALRTLLEEALALPAAERTTWLESLAGEQAHLKDTLLELLAAHGQVETGTSLATSPRLARAGDAAPGTGELAAGHVIGATCRIAPGDNRQASRDAGQSHAGGHADVSAS